MYLCLCLCLYFLPFAVQALITYMIYSVCAYYLMSNGMLNTVYAIKHLRRYFTLTQDLAAL